MEPGLRLQLELPGPEYALEHSSLNTELKICLSREVRSSEGEALGEQQNAEHGLMPVWEDEAGVYGYTAEHRHIVGALRTSKQPGETFADGVAVVKMLLALRRSAELGQTVHLSAPELETYGPLVARVVA